jgi:hypothetical protein
LFVVWEDVVDFFVALRDFPFTLSAMVVVLSPRPFGVASRDEDSSFMALLPPAVLTFFELGILSDAVSTVVGGMTVVATEAGSLAEVD